jgi:purine-nucleoside/S-methyl-5'-thioadenosine phosphorylase / adenosine deaminase
MLILRTGNLSDLPGIAHGFFGRTGGVSTGLFESLNCGPGSGDDPAKVAENRRRVSEALGGGALVTLHQVHSPDVVVVNQTYEMGKGPQADAMATAMPNIALGILTADCAPVLLADGEAGVIGAAHAGWKGALTGVIEAAVGAMETLGANRARMVAAVGPCISQKNYEVGPEFCERFLSADAANARFFIASDRPDHFRFDLDGYAAARLAAAGIANVEPLSACSYAREGDFFSFRRATHRKESAYGRQISAIRLTG